MKRETLFDAITNIREDTLARAEGYAEQKSPRRRRWISVVAAVLVAAVTMGVLLRPGGVLNAGAYALARPEYPVMAPYPIEADYIDPDTKKFDSDGFSAAWGSWRADQKAQQGPAGYATGLTGYFTRSIPAFLSDAGEDNRVFSPLNVYMALAMLAETAGGDSRQQILDLLGHDSIESLRAQAGDLWNANYRDDGATTSLLAGSLWMRDDLDYVQSTVDTLAQHYYASVFRGEMGSAGYDKALQNWLNEQTGGLLKEYAGQVTMDPQTVLALAATVYFKAKWADGFREENTAPDTFHAPGGGVTADFMNGSSTAWYAWGETFSATCLQMENAGAMYLLLPDEGYTVEDMLADPAAMSMLMSPESWPDSKYLTVNLSMPKFDVSSSIDLKEGLGELGVTQVFDRENADFTPLTPLAETENVWVEKAGHAARVVVDEEGVEAAAYTVMTMDMSGMPPSDEVDFVLDRPFIFLLTGIDGLPLFVGVVNTP